MNPNKADLPTTPSLKPILRGHFHQAAFFATLGAGALMVATASQPKTKWMALIYILSLASLYGCSAFYHRPNWEEEKRKWLRRLDHSSIFLFFGGTAVPVCLLGMPFPAGEKLLILIFIGVVLGIAKTLFWIHAPKWLNVILYSVLGFLALPYIPELHQGLGPSNFSLLISGGAIYLFGAIMYALKWPNQNAKWFGYHELFHLLVILASILHFVVVYNLVH